MDPDIHNRVRRCCEGAYNDSSRKRKVRAKKHSSIVSAVDPLEEGRSAWPRPSLCEILTLERGETALFFPVTFTYWQSVGFRFEAVNGPALMQRATRSSRAPFCQALKKSACMVDPGGSPG